MGSFEEYDFGQFAAKKAFEISYALFRVAGMLHQQGFAERLRHQALAILELGTKSDCGGLKKELPVTISFLQLGGDTGVIHPDSANIVMNEINKLDSAIAEFESTAIVPDYGLQDIFSPSVFAAKQKEIADQKRQKPAGRSRQTAASKERQSAIIERIRQIGNCRLKEIKAYFPQISERTLRYDLEDLVTKDSIERIGTHGPAIIYRAKIAEAVMPISLPGVVEEEVSPGEAADANEA